MLDVWEWKPGARTRNRFHAFYMPKFQNHAHARSSTYRTPYQRRTRPPGAHRGVARPQAVLLAAERLSPLRVPMGQHGNPFAALRHNGLQLLQGLFRRLGEPLGVKWRLTVSERKSLRL